MEKILRIFFSFWTSFILMFLYAFFCATATFVENDFGTAAAKSLIYDNAWFDVLHLLLGLNLIGVIFYAKLFQRKKYASLLLHFSFIVILFGAALTRYFGLEGGMHIREGESSNTIVTREEFITLINYDSNASFEFPISFTKLNQKHFKQNIVLDGKNIYLESKNYTAQKDNITPAVLEINIKYKDENKNIFLIPNFNNKNIIPFKLKDKTFGLNWGPKEIKIPFELKLNDFILERYLGSMTPSSYASDINIIDRKNNVDKPYLIFMNNVLDYGGYRFFQSSYDLDEQGTILSVNKDPGKIPTYIGYFLLSIGFLWVIFSKNGRFFKLANYLKKRQYLSILFVFFILFQTPSFADENKEQIVDLIKYLQKNSYEHALDFGTLLVQDFNGRIKPMDTLAMEFVYKITKEEKFLNLHYNQIFLAMMVYPKEFRQIKMISTKSEKLRQIIGLSKDDTKIAFDDVFDDGIYKLSNYVEEANRKKPNLRDQFDKDLLEVDERINTAYYIYSGQALTLFPDINEKSLKWFSPANALPFSYEDTQRIRNLLGNYFLGVHKAIKTNDWQEADDGLNAIKDFQIHYGSKVLPQKERLELEIVLNHYNIFDNLTYIYISFGLVFFIIIFYTLLSNKRLTRFVYIVFYSILCLSVFIHTIALLMRWYIGNHAPWSNAYESMIYIAWACAISGVVFFRKSYFALAASGILAGICLFVAHLGFMDPQITNLIPVLKSYWLNIHVSIITASYGFLALCFMLGLINLVLFIFKDKNEMIKQNIINIHCINEMSMILGLAMLSVGNFLGGVWANESWGRYWGWDSKETWALISIVIYTLTLHLRFIIKTHFIFVFTCASVLSFYSILMTYFGVNYFLSGLHSYASGDPLAIPSFIYYIVLMNFILIIMAGFKRELQTPNF